MKQISSNDSTDKIESAIHLEFIQSLAESGDEDGLEQTAEFHRSIFLHHHGPDLERHRHEEKLGEERTAALENRLGRVNRKLAEQDKLVPASVEGRPDTAPNPPWNIWDATMFTLAGLGVAALLAFGVMNISFNLIESGIVSFSESPFRAYFWAALLPIGALAVKIGWDVLRSERMRALYLWACLGSGVVAVFVWVGAYASIYPSLSTTTEEHIAALSVFDSTSSTASFSTGGAKTIDMILVAAQATAEICLSALLGIFMTRVYAKHRPVRLAYNPTFVQFDVERRSIQDELASESRALAIATGSREQIERKLDVFVAYAGSLFKKEVRRRKDHGHRRRQLLDDIALELRQKLDSVDHELNTNDEDEALVAIERPELQANAS
jgi:hypothetical protein